MGIPVINRLINGAATVRVDRNLAPFGQVDQMPAEFVKEADMGAAASSKFDICELWVASPDATAPPGPAIASPTAVWSGFAARLQRFLAASGIHPRSR
jgi:hypothetical protein